ASCADPVTVFPGSQVFNLELHSKEVRFHFLTRSTYVAQPIACCNSIINFALRNKPNALAGIDDTREIFAIIVSQESRIPWANRLSQLPANKPCCGLHMPVSFPLPGQPLSWVKVGPERRRNELCSGWTRAKAAPSRRKEHSSTGCLLGGAHLMLDLIPGKQVVCVEPLDVIAPA